MNNQVQPSVRMNGLNLIQDLVYQIEGNAANMAVSRDRYNQCISKAHCASNEADAAHYNECAAVYLDEFKLCADQLQQWRDELNHLILVLSIEANN